MRSQFGVSFSKNVPDAEEATVSKVKSKPQRRVSLGYAIDAETGEVLETTKRQSTRETTRLNTQGLHSRLRNAENKKVWLGRSCPHFQLTVEHRSQFPNAREKRNVD